MKIESPSSWTSPNPTTKEDGQDAAILEYSMDMEAINAQIFLNKICTNTYSPYHSDHRKPSFSTLTHWSSQIWIQKSRTLIFNICIKSKSSLKKWQLCHRYTCHRLNVLYSQCRRQQSHPQCQYGQKYLCNFKRS